MERRAPLILALVSSLFIACGPRLSGIFTCGSEDACPDGLVCDGDRICRERQRLEAPGDLADLAMSVDLRETAPVDLRKPDPVDLRSTLVPDLVEVAPVDLLPACTPTRQCWSGGIECGIVANDGCGQMLDCGKCMDPTKQCGVRMPNKCDKGD